MTVVDFPDPAAIYADAFSAGMRPDPLYTTSEWAEAKREVTTGANRGRWRNSLTPYLVEIMDCFSAQSLVQEVTVMKAARMGGSAAFDNVAGYVIEVAPAEMLMVFPRDPDVKAASKERIAPMIAGTPSLRERVSENKSRDGKNTIDMKLFMGGYLGLVYASSAASLGARTARYVLGDEIDRWPDDVDGEGDPINLVKVRTRTYGSRAKLGWVSTPTDRGRSKIETHYLRGDRRRFYLRCPACSRWDYLTFTGKDWLHADVGLHHRIAYDEGKPETAAMECASCTERIPERLKEELLAAGEWVPARHRDAMLAGEDWKPAADAELKRSYHISGLYSPLGWLSWEKIVRDFEESRRMPHAFKVFVNTTLGEPWEVRSEAPAEVDVLMKRRETYPAQVPAGVGILIASIDTQGTWLEIKVKGYGASEESWLIDWTQIHNGAPEEGEETRPMKQRKTPHMSAPLNPSTWRALDEFLLQPYQHESGRKLYIEGVTIDSSGHHTDEVYRFCAGREARKVGGGFEQHVVAIRGGSTTEQPLVGRPTTTSYGTKLVTLCVDTGRATVFDRLKLNHAQPGYMHFPDWLDRDYFEQLTSLKPTRRQGKRRWVETNSARQEAIDLEVYALGGLYILAQYVLGPVLLRNLARRAAMFAAPLPAAPEAPPTPAPPPPPTNPITGIRRGGWMSRVKR